MISVIESLHQKALKSVLCVTMYALIQTGYLQLEISLEKSAQKRKRNKVDFILYEILNYYANSWKSIMRVLRECLTQAGCGLNTRGLLYVLILAHVMRMHAPACRRMRKLERTHFVIRRP